jgi:hypothetical protein
VERQHFAGSGVLIFDLAAGAVFKNSCKIVTETFSFNSRNFWKAGARAAQKPTGSATLAAPILLFSLPVFSGG